jgi:hypothetical protein
LYQRSHCLGETGLFLAVDEKYNTWYRTEKYGPFKENCGTSRQLELVFWHSGRNSSLYKQFLEKTI